MYNGPEEEKSVYQTQAIRTMISEAEVMALRSRKHSNELHAIDKDMEERLKTITNSDIKDMLTEMWQEITHNQEQSLAKWNEKQKWWTKSVRPVSDPENKQSKNSRSHRSMTWNSEHHEPRENNNYYIHPKSDHYWMTNDQNPDGDTRRPNRRHRQQTNRDQLKFNGDVEGRLK